MKVPWHAYLDRSVPTSRLEIGSPSALPKATSQESPAGINFGKAALRGHSLPLRRSVAVAATFGLASLITGCGTGSGEYKPDHRLIVVVADSSCDEPTTKLALGVLAVAAESASKYDGSVAFDAFRTNAVASLAFDTKADFKLDRPDPEPDNIPKQQQRLFNEAWPRLEKEATDAWNQLRGGDCGTDAAGAVLAASRQLDHWRSSYPEAPRHLVTTGNFLHNTPDFDTASRAQSDVAIASFISKLRRKDLLSDLSGTSVTMVGFGLRSSPGPVPNERRQAAVKFWKAYLRASKADPRLVKCRDTAKGLKLTDLDPRRGTPFAGC